MKIALLVYRLNGIGGIAKHVLLLARELATLGHEVDVWAVEYDAAQCYPDLTRGLNICALRSPAPVAADLYDLPVGKRMLAYLAQLWKAFLDQQHLFEALPDGYDVVNPHGDHVQWAAAAYKNRCGVPAVWMCNDFWPPAGQHEADGSMSGKLKELAKQPLVYPFERYDRWSAQRMDHIVVLSERVKAQMLEHYGVPSVVIRTGIAAPEVVPSRRPGQVFQLLTVCTMMPRRRIEDALEAIHLLAQEDIKLHYTIVGRMDHTPSYTEFVQSEIRRLQLEDRVTFTGEVSDESLAAYFQASDAFVWPADEGQSWGMACMEAMAYGKPVLVSKANGLAEVLRDGENSLLFPSSDAQALAAAIKRLVMDRTLRQQIAQEGQRLVRAEYSWRRNAEAMLSLFAEVQRKNASQFLEATRRSEDT